MQRFQNTYTAGAVPGPSTGDWQAEISGSGTAGIHAQDAAGQMPEAERNSFPCPADGWYLWAICRGSEQICRRT